MSRVYRGRGATSSGRGATSRGRVRLVDIPIEMPPHHSNDSLDRLDPLDPLHSPANQTNDVSLDEEDDYFPTEEEDFEQNDQNSTGIRTETESTNGRILISLNAKGELCPSRECQVRLKESIEIKFRDEAECWSKVSIANKDLIFDHWKSFFQWDPRIPESGIRVPWEKKAACTFKNKMYYLRKKAKGARPRWLAENAHGSITNYWKSETFIKLSKRNSDNRALGRGVVMHRGGARSRDSTGDKLRVELRREPSQAEIWTATNATTDKDGNLVFKTAEAEIMHNNYLRKLAEHPDVQGKGDDYQPPMELQLKVWADTQGTSKKGAVVGLASDAKLVRPSTSRTPSSSTYHDPAFVNLSDEVVQLRSQNASLLEKQSAMLEEQSTLIEKQSALEQQLRNVNSRLEERDKFMESQMRSMMQSIMTTPSNVVLPQSPWIPENMSQPETYPLYRSRAPGEK